MQTKTTVKAGVKGFNHNVRSLRVQTGAGAGVGKGDTQDPPAK